MRLFNSCSLFIGLALFASFSSVLGQPPLSMSGFAWAENLIFDGKCDCSHASVFLWGCLISRPSRGNLFVSDAQTGIFWRISLDSTRNQYSRQVHVGNFSRCLGLAIDPTGVALFGIAIAADSTSYLIKMDPSAPGVWTTVAKTAKPGNGPRCSPR